MFPRNTVQKHAIDLDKSNVSSGIHVPTHALLWKASGWYTYRYAIVACVIIVLNACMRLALIAHDWPQTNSDEGTVGLMALHIAYYGSHPIFLYGQGSLGALEAYVGAALFLVFGPSLLSLRLSMILLFSLFLISMYLLTSLLYTKKLSLVTLILLSLASPDLLFRQLAVLAGHPDTPLFGAVLVLLATWLALTYRQDIPPRARRKRTVLYGTWGLIAGAAFWNDPLAAPFILLTGIGLLLFCRAELRGATLLSIFLGVLIGVSPLLIYNVSVPFDQNSSSIFGFLVSQGPGQPHPSLLEKLAAAVLVSVPVATEAIPLCQIGNRESWPLTAHSSPHVIQCTIVHGFWGLGVIVLWAIAFLPVLRVLWKPTFRAALRASLPEGRRVAIIQFARFMLLASAGLSFLVFVLSSQGVSDPWSNNRYLVSFAVATPAMLWPLWTTLGAAGHLSLRSVLLKILCGSVLLLLISTLALGTIDAFDQVPQVEARTQQDRVLVHDLVRLGATHIYSDYWTCDLVAFLSQEQIVCATLDGYLRPGFDRYAPYRAIVKSDPYASYVFPVGSQEALTFAANIAQSGKHYQLTVIDGYAVYQQSIQ